MTPKVGPVARTLVRPDVRAFLDILNGTPMGHIGESGVAETRAMFDQARAAKPPVGRRLAVVRDLTFPGPADEVRLRFYDCGATIWMRGARQSG